MSFRKGFLSGISAVVVPLLFFTQFSRYPPGCSFRGSSEQLVSLSSLVWDNTNAAPAAPTVPVPPQSLGDAPGSRAGQTLAQPPGDVGISADSKALERQVRDLALRLSALEAVPPDRMTKQDFNVQQDEGQKSFHPADSPGPPAKSQQQFSHDDKFVVLDQRAELTSMNRWCIAYGIIFARMSRRIFVAPSLWAGLVVDPNIDIRDGLDFWDMAQAAPHVRMVSMRSFLAQYPLQKQADGHWGPGSGSNFQVHELWPLSTQSEMVLASSLHADKANNAAKVIVLRENGQQNMCWRFKEVDSMHDWRRKVYHGLDKPSERVRQYAMEMIAHHGGDFVVTQWRSMTNPLMYTLQDVNPDQQLPPENQTHHHQDCAKQIVSAANHIASKTNLTAIMVFTDLHIGCNAVTQVCGYTEFDDKWATHPTLNADRESAVSYLANHKWRDGDELVASYLQEHPLFQGYERDMGLMGVLMEQVCINAPAFLTCTQHDCSDCGRSVSGFSRAIVARRMESAQHKCRTWASWTPPLANATCEFSTDDG